MVNTSDDNGDPPDPPNANPPTDALFTHSPTVHSAKNDSIPTEIDQDLPSNSSHRPPIPTTRHIDHDHTDQDRERSPVLNNNAPTHPDNANNDSFSTDIDAKMEFYKTNRTPSPTDNPSPKQPSCPISMQIWTSTKQTPILTPRPQPTAALSAPAPEPTPLT